MIQGLPAYINLIFILSVLLTFALLLRAIKKFWFTFFILAGWMFFQTVISLTGFYTVTTTTPPRFLFLILPPVLLILFLLFSANGKQFIESINLKKLTLVNTVRIPVEIVLYLLFLEKQIPELMTFAGRNYDIIAGISAPLIVFFAFKSNKVNRSLLLFWNSICFALLLNIVINAILSAPFPFQQFAFDQPNVGVFYFPFTLLPGFIVPVALFSHLVSIRRLLTVK